MAIPRKPAARALHPVPKYPEGLVAHGVLGCRGIGRLRVPGSVEAIRVPPETVKIESRPQTGKVTTRPGSESCGGKLSRRLQVRVLSGVPYCAVCL